MINTTNTIYDLDIIKETVKYLVLKPTDRKQLLLQKRLASIARRLIQVFKNNEMVKEYVELLNELINLHEEFKGLGGNVLALQINKDKYPDIFKEIQPLIFTKLPYEELYDFIDFLEKHLLAVYIKNNISKIVESLLSYTNLSDDELLDKYKTLITDEFLNLVNANTDNTELDFNPNNLDEIMEVLEMTIEESKNKLRVPSGYEILDRNVLPGGFEAGRVYLFGAMPGGGKSTFMINLVKNFVYTPISQETLKSDKPPLVLYITLENNEIETFERLSRCILEKEIRLFNITDQIEQEIKNAFSKFKNRLKVKYFKPGTDFNSLLMYITKLNEEFRLIAIVVDYLDLISLKQTKEKRHELGQITFKLKSLANMFNCPVITPTQLNTAAYSNTIEGESSNKIVIPTIKNLDESRQKAQNADFVALLFKLPKSTLPYELSTQYYDDRYEVLGINIDKNRDGSRGIVTAIYDKPIYSIKLFDDKTNYQIYKSLLRLMSSKSNQNE